MNAFWMLIMLFCINTLPASAQHLKNDPLTFVFKSGRAELQRISFYANSSLGITRSAAAKQLVSSFSEETFVAYQKYFKQGECHVDSITFNQWRSSLGSAQPNIVASFELLLGDQQYCIVKYTLPHNHLTFAFGQLFKKLNGAWYFCNLEENLQKTDLIMFFTLVQEAFFNAWKKDRFEMQQDPCFVQNGFINGSGLINAYFDKYRSDHPCYSALNLLFEDRIQAIGSRNTDEITQIEQYFMKASLPAEEIDYLIRLVKSHNTHLALSHFSQLSGMSTQEITHQIPKESTHE